MSNNANLIKKGDVLWVPYRRDPLWPALVQNCYPKKVTFLFFPLPEDLTTIRAMTFNCHPKLTYSLHVDEKLPENANQELCEAFQAACTYLNERNVKVGSSIPGRSATEISIRVENGSTHNNVNNDEDDEAKKSEEGGEKRKSRERSHHEKPRKKRSRGGEWKSNPQSDEEGDSSTAATGGQDPPSPVKSLSSFSFTTESSSARSPSLSFSGLPRTSETKQEITSPGPSNGEGGLDEAAMKKLLENEEEFEEEFQKDKESALKKRSKNIMIIIDENIEMWFNQMWDSNRVRFYTNPTRDGLSINFRNNRILTVDDFDTVVERLLQMARNRNNEMSMVTSLHLTTTILLPHVMVSAWAKFKSVSYERALRAYNKPRKSINGYSNTAGTGLDELCRIACKQRELINKS